MPAGTPRSLFIIFPQSRNVQRLGSLITVTKLASFSRATPLQDLARSYRATVTSPISVQEDQREQILKYLGKRNLARKYKLDSPKISIEAQDWLLSDPRLPSHTGNEKEDVRPTIDLAAQLGLLWPTSYQRTWVGDLLANNTGDVVHSFKVGDRQANPFWLTLPQKTICAYVVLEADHTFLRFLVKILNAFPREIEIPALIERVRAGFDSFVQETLRPASGPEDTHIAKILGELRNQILRDATGRRASASGITVQTLRRSFEEILYWRLEALVDLGYLKKVDPDAYVYTSTACFQPLRTVLEMSLADEFFSHWSACVFGKPAQKATDLHRVRELLFEANQERCNAMGYTLIREGTLVANIAALVRRRDEVIEVSTALSAISQGSDNRYKILTSVDRNRNLSAYKMVKIQ